MTNDNSTPNGLHVQLGGLSYELVIAVSAVHAGVEMLGRRPDIPAAMKPPLQILENLASEAVEASISLQSSLWEILGLGITAEPANDEQAPLDPHNPDDFSGADGDDDPA